MPWKEALRRGTLQISTMFNNSYDLDFELIQIKFWQGFLQKNPDPVRAKKFSIDL